MGKRTGLLGEIAVPMTGLGDDDSTRDQRALERLETELYRSSKALLADAAMAAHSVSGAWQIGGLTVGIGGRHLIGKFPAGLPNDRGSYGATNW